MLVLVLFYVVFLNAACGNPKAVAFLRLALFLFQLKILLKCYPLVNFCITNNYGKSQSLIGKSTISMDHVQ